MLSLIDYWVWDDEEAQEEIGQDENAPEEAWAGGTSADLELAPRFFDVTCPVCASWLEYDAREIDVNVLKLGRNGVERRA